MSETVILRGQRHTVWECGSCGVVCTCPEIVYEQHRAEGGYHTCPNGHSWGWNDNGCEREKLRRERDRLKQTVAQKDDEIAMQASRALKAESEIIRLHKRAKAGVCPCCNRTFVNMARHMKTKHPNVMQIQRTAS